MRSRRTWCAIAAFAAVAGCSRQDAALCQPEARYATARSAQPVQIPDDLSPPNESDALRLPPDLAAGGTVTAGACLEAPPSFFGDSRRLVAGSDSEDEPRRQSRREARRAARAEAAGEPGAAPAEPREPAPAGGDERVIDN